MVNRILARIREALQQPAPARHLEQHGHHISPPTPEDRAHWLPQVPTDWNARIELFAKNSAALKTEWLPCHSPQDLASTLQQLAVSSGWTRIGTHTLSFGQEAVDLLALPTTVTDFPFLSKNLEQCSVGITGCESLIAQTGSILISSVSSGGRCLSILPPHHVVIAHKDQLVSDLFEAFHSLQVRYADNIPPYISFITGSSRTGDIERILVLGAHGPKKLSILFCTYSKTPIK